MTSEFILRVNSRGVFKTSWIKIILLFYSRVGLRICSSRLASCFAALGVYRGKGVVLNPCNFQTTSRHLTSSSWQSKHGRTFITAQRTFAVVLRPKFHAASRALESRTLTLTFAAATLCKYANLSLQPRVRLNADVTAWSPESREMSSWRSYTAARRLQDQDKRTLRTLQRGNRREI